LTGGKKALSHVVALSHNEGEVRERYSTLETIWMYGHSGFHRMGDRISCEKILKE
jgi:hypothetical protein